MNDINDYKKWKAAWEKSYPIYRDLCKELEENRNLFERLGAEMRSAVAHEEQLRVIALIEKHYNERNEVTSPPPPQTITTTCWVVLSCLS